MKFVISSALLYTLLICHQGSAYSDQKSSLADCLAANELEMSVFGASVIKDIKLNSYRHLFRPSLDVKKRNCLAACIFQNAGFINGDGRFTGETIPKIYRHLPGSKVTACKEIEELCAIRGCLLEAMYS